MSSTTFDLKDKVIAITGAASGIGAATAELLASYGAVVSLADMDLDGLQSMKTRIDEVNGRCMVRKVNVSISREVQDWIDQTVKDHGKLDGAANLAGIVPRGINVDRVEDLQDEEWCRVIDVNLTGVMYCMRSQIQNMNSGGSIVNAASVAGLRGFAKNSAYVASKHAVIGLTKSAAKEVGDRQIRVNCLAPGLIDTPMQRFSVETRGMELPLTQQPIQRKGRAEEVAELISWLLCDKSTFISGTVQRIDGGWFA